MSDDWQKPDPETAARLLSEAGPRLTPVPFSPETGAVRVQKPSFWPGWMLLELTDLSTVPPARKHAIYKPGDIAVMDGSNKPFYDTNEKAPVKLDRRTVVDYVKVFFAHVRGRHGRFLIVETIDDIRWQIEPPAQGRKVMQEMLAPVSVAGQEEDGTFLLDAFMVFKDSLFRTRVHVRPDGLVAMSDEELKIEGMPVLQDAAA
jgi:hypothetical protein